MSNVDLWPYSEGLYVEDNCLPVCTGVTRSRYRQVGGNGYLWPFGYFWMGTTVLCDDGWATREFSGEGSTTANSPEMVTGWYITKTTRDFYQTHGSLTVVAVADSLCPGESVGILYSHWMDFIELYIFYFYSIDIAVFRFFIIF